MTPPYSFLGWFDDVETAGKSERTRDVSQRSQMGNKQQVLGDLVPLSISLNSFILKYQTGQGEDGSAVKPSSLCPIPRSQVVEGENRLSLLSLVFLLSHCCLSHTWHATLHRRRK